MTETDRPPGARAAALAAARLYLTQWRRSRAPLGLAAFVIAICVFDTVTWRGRQSVPWSLPFALLAAWTGMLAGFDSYGQLGRDGALRMLLRRSAPRPAFALGMVLGGALTSVSAACAALLYLLATGRAPLSPAVALALPRSLLAIVGFVAFGQALSLLLPRDGAAIAGMLVIAFGASPAERWLPAGAPAALAAGVHVLWSMLPTSVRVAELIGGRSGLLDAGVMAAQAFVAFWVICAMLNRPARRALRGAT